MTPKQYNARIAKLIKTAKTLRLDMCACLDLLEDEYPDSSSASNVLYAIQHFNDVIDALELEVPATAQVSA